MGGTTLTFDEVIAWLHARLGQRIVLNVNLEAGLPAIVAYGVLQRGVDPSLNPEGRDIVGEGDDLLLFAIGAGLAGTLFVLSRRRFGSARLTTDTGGTVILGQMSVVYALRESVEGDPGWELGELGGT